MSETLLSSPLAILIGILCLTVCIFVHELGHFLAARWRGAHVPRFSVFGLGPVLFSKTWRGVEWCICAIPFGAYVQIPQLADMGEIEGGQAGSESVPLKPLRYRDKVIAAAAGPAFNIAFAFLLATALWIAGQEIGADQATTRIGYVSPTIKLSDGRKETSPAAAAGLQVGDIIREIDGNKVENWQDVIQGIIFGAGNSNGKRTCHLLIEREGRQLTLVVQPQLATDEKVRRIGISPYVEPKVYSVEADSPAAKAGFRAEDRIASVNGKPIHSFGELYDGLLAAGESQLALGVVRNRTERDVVLPAGSLTANASKLGMAFTTDTTIIHVDPFTQLGGFVSNTFTTLWSLINPSSDIGLSKMGGPIGIVQQFTKAAQAGYRPLLWLTILINVALAIFNLLPIPVLDGGHIVFATVAKLRGRPLPVEFIGRLQFVFFVLLISMMLYVSSQDIRRLRREKPDTPASSAPATATPPPAR
jgi:regulator of sigma E protease